MLQKDGVRAGQALDAGEIFCRQTGGQGFLQFAQIEGGQARNQASHLGVGSQGDQ